MPSMLVYAALRWRAPARQARRRHTSLTLSRQGDRFLPANLQSVRVLSAEGGQLPALQCLWQNGCPWDEFTCISAAAGPGGAALGTSARVPVGQQSNQRGHQVVPSGRGSLGPRKRVPGVGCAISDGLKAIRSGLFGSVSSPFGHRMPLEAVSSASRCHPGLLPPLAPMCQPCSSAAATSDVVVNLLR